MILGHRKIFYVLFSFIAEDRDIYLFSFLSIVCVQRHAWNAESSQLPFVVTEFVVNELMTVSQLTESEELICIKHLK